MLSLKEPFPLVLDPDIIQRLTQRAPLARNIKRVSKHLRAKPTTPSRFAAQPEKRVKFTPCVFLTKMFTARDAEVLTNEEQMTCNTTPAAGPGEQTPKHCVNTPLGVHPNAIPLSAFRPIKFSACKLSPIAKSRDRQIAQCPNSAIRIPKSDNVGYNS